LGPAAGVPNISLGVNTTGDMEVDNALMDCGQYGLSEEAMSYAEDHACDDMNSIATDTGNHMDSGTTEKAAGLEGCETAKNHDRAVDQARMNLASLVLQLNQLKAEYAITQASNSK
jgi:hypothetical protein